MKNRYQLRSNAHISENKVSYNISSKKKLIFLTLSSSHTPKEIWSVDFHVKLSKLPWNKLRASNQTQGIMCMHAQLLSCYLTLCNSTDGRPLGSSVDGIFQARILECCHLLLQEIFLTLGSNPCLLQWQVDSSSLSH